MRSLTFILVLAALAFAACGDDDDDESAAPATSEVVIKTSVSFEDLDDIRGEVLSASSLGDSPFCPEGTFRDDHGDAEIGSVDRTFECPDGTLRVGFSPAAPEGGVQRGPWKIISGTGSFEGISGSGEMEVEAGSGGQSDEGRETFTGTVTE